MDIRTKNIIFVLVLVLIFAVLVIFYIFALPKPIIPTVATSTPTVVTPLVRNQAQSSAIHIIEHGQYYDADLQYPSATALLSRDTSQTNTNNVIIKTLKDFSETTLRDFKINGKFASLTAIQAQDEGLAPGKKFSISDGYTSYEGSGTLSYVFNIFENTLGAHPVTTFQTFTFNVQTGQTIRLSDVFISNSNYLVKLSTLSKKALTTNLGSNADTTFINAGTMPQESNFQNFALNGKNLLLIFPPYKVAPGSLGSQTIQIPLSQLSTVLKPGYQ